MVWLVISRRDWRAGAVLASLAAGWLPWFWYADHNERTMFSFYAVAFLPFLDHGHHDLPRVHPRPQGRLTARDEPSGATAVGAYLLLAALAAVRCCRRSGWARRSPYEDWLDRLFGLRSWI